MFVVVRCLLLFVCCLLLVFVDCWSLFVVCIFWCAVACYLLFVIVSGLWFAVCVVACCCLFC